MPRRFLLLKNFPFFVAQRKRIYRRRESSRPFSNPWACLHPYDPAFPLNDESGAGQNRTNEHLNLNVCSPGRHVISQNKDPIRRYVSRETLCLVRDTFGIFPEDIQCSLQNEAFMVPPFHQLDRASLGAVSGCTRLPVSPPSRS